MSCGSDNLCYKFGLGERTHARVEDKGRIELSSAEATGMARSKIAHIILIVVSILFAVAMAGRSNQAYFDGEIEQQDLYIVIGLASPVIVYWLGGVVEAFDAETDHRTWARFGLVGKIAWVTAMRALCLIPMVGLMAWAMWGGGGKWDQAVAEDEEATIAYWQNNGLS